MKVILYKRVSTDEQADKGFSLKFQDDFLRNYCKTHNYKILGDYVDDASGKDFNRPAYGKLKEWLEKNKGSVDMILFTRWDRFGRNIEFCLTEKRILLEFGVHVNAVQQWVDHHKDDNNIVMLSLHLAIGENDRKTIISRTTAGSNEARRQGWYCGKAPYGYENIRDRNGKSTLKIVEDKAAFVRQAFEEVALGVDSVEAIFKKLRKEGLGITKQTFYRMFHNPTYCGRIHVTAHLDKPETVVEGKHEGIVSVQTFLKAQANKVENRWKGIVPKREDANFPLRNYLKCPHCKKNLTGSPSKGRNKSYFYYHCRNGCPTRVSVEVAHELFDKLLKSIEVKKELHDVLVETIESTILQLEGDSKKELRDLKYSVKRTLEQMEKLDQQLLNSHIPPDRFNRLSDALEKKLREAEFKIHELETRKSPSREKMDKVLWIMSNLSVVYKNADYKGKRKFLQALFPEKIILDKDKCRTTNLNEVLALVASISASFEQKKSGTNLKNSDKYRFVLEAGLEPARPKRAQDFKSGVSTNSTTRACLEQCLPPDSYRDPPLEHQLIRQISLVVFLLLA